MIVGVKLKHKLMDIPVCRTRKVLAQWQTMPTLLTSMITAWLKTTRRKVCGRRGMRRRREEIDAEMAREERPRISISFRLLAYY